MRIKFSTFSAAFLTLSTLACLPAVATAQSARPVVFAMLQNEAGVHRDLVDWAQAEVARLFNLADVEIRWVTEVPEHGTRLRVVSVTTWEPSEKKVQASVLGYTHGSEGKRGTRAYVFWRRVEQASQKFTASRDRVLAIAIAHELGHMLLPDGKHAKAGLMAGPWDANHFRSASAGLLAFSTDTARLIQREMEKELATTTASSVRLPN